MGRERDRKGGRWTEREGKEQRRGRREEMSISVGKRRL